ncbi:hypothetical protein K457DRAFT_131607 [Linnemannia elongata AG-77]|uniref:Alpha/beta-hydrolase n=1 Tax=Linnemannia elongata AG-77 TaxID=1314771 RepID=A0A197KJD3_9FUNG|nr:hypothetical protein K457DRAFT_131607 [Linnemannia elongata AG-77]
MASIPIPRRYRTIVYIPSRSDGTMLEVCLSIPTSTSSQPQVYTGVVIAHPYGPLGGSYNNNVVGALLQWFETSSLSAPITLSTKKSKKGATGKRNSTGARKGSLDQDTGNAGTAASPTSAKSAGGGAQAESLACIICAFNFRGCGKSKGKTSWFGEAEREDYQTVVDFLQSGSRTGTSTSHLNNIPEQRDSGTGSPASNRAVFDETGREIDPPRLPFLSRFILSGFSYGGMVASSIPPPLRNPADPASAHLPTTYIMISYPAGVAWFLTSGAQSGFYKRARAILQGEQQPSGDATAAAKNDTETTTATETDTDAGDTQSKKSTIEAYFITGADDQFTSPKTLLNWLKTNAGLNPPNTLTGGSWALTRPDGAIHVDVVKGVDHFWLDREQELVDRLQAWWSDTHSV